MNKSSQYIGARIATPLKKSKVSNQPHCHHNYQGNTNFETHQVVQQNHRGLGHYQGKFNSLAKAPSPISKYKFVPTLPLQWFYNIFDLFIIRQILVPLFDQFNRDYDNQSLISLGLLSQDRGTKEIFVNYIKSTAINVYVSSKPQLRRRCFYCTECDCDRRDIHGQ